METIKVKSDLYYNDLYTNNGKGYYVVGSYSSDSFFLVKEEKINYYKKLFQALDGKHSIEEIEKQGLGNIKILNGIIKKLKYYGLIEGYNKKSSFSEVDIMTLNLYKKELCCTDDKKKRYAEIMVNMYKRILLLLLIIFFLMLCFGPYRERLIELWNMTHCFDVSLKYNGVISYFFVLLLTPLALIIHEIGHRIVGIKNGLNEGCIAIVLFMYIIPLMYVKQKNIYSLKREKAIQVIIAGIMTNLLVGMGLLVLALIINSTFLLYFALANFKLIVINVMPFSLSDGYFLINILLCTPNIRKYMYEVIDKPKRIVKKSIKERILIFTSVMIMIFSSFFEINWLCSFISFRYRVVIAIGLNILYLFIIRNNAKKYIDLNMRRSKK